VLLQCETRTLGKDLFEWKEYVPNEGNPPSKYLRGKPGPKSKVETVTQGKPENA